MQYQKGQSGNPGGRPLGRSGLTDCYWRLFELPLDELLAYKPRLVKEEIARQMILKALNGEYQAVHELNDRTEGKAEQKQILVGEEGAPGILIEFSNNGQGKVQPDAKADGSVPDDGRPDA